MGAMRKVAGLNLSASPRVGRVRFNVMKPDSALERDSLAWTPFVCVSPWTRCGLPLSHDGRDRLLEVFRARVLGCLHAFRFLLSSTEGDSSPRLWKRSAGLA